MNMGSVYIIYMMNDTNKTETEKKMTKKVIDRTDAMITINTGRITRNAMPAQQLEPTKNSDVVESWMLEGPRGGAYVLYIYSNGTFRCFNFGSSSMNDLATGRQDLVTIDRVETEETTSETPESVEATTGNNETETKEETVEETGPTTTPDERRVIAQTIIEQMGGWGRLRAMTGAKVVEVIDCGARVRFPNRIRNLANCIVVKYEMGMDLYNVEFWRVSPSQPWNDKQLKTYDGVYCDMLVSLFEENTGLRLVL